MATEKYCGACGTVATPKTHTPGAFVLELLLWVGTVWLFCLPGLAYSVWRLTARTKVCRACGSPYLMPTDAPRAQGR